MKTVCVFKKTIIKYILFHIQPVLIDKSKTQQLWGHRIFDLIYVKYFNKY